MSQDRKVTISYTGLGYSEFVPPGCDPNRVSLFALIEEEKKQYYWWRPLPDAVFSDPCLMEGFKQSLREHALNCNLRSLAR